MDNVENTRQPGRFGAIWFVHAFTWLFYGIVAPLNAILLIGSVVLLVDLLPFDVGKNIPVNLLLLATGGVGVLIGRYLKDAAKTTYLVRVFGRGLWGIAWIVVGISVIVQVASWRDFDVGSFVCGAAGQNLGLSCFVNTTIKALGAVWFLTAINCLILYAFSAKGAKNLGDKVLGQRQIYPSICAAMIVLWMVFTSAFWLAFRNLVEGLSTPKGGAPGTHGHEPKGLLHDTFTSQMDGALGTLLVTSVGFVALLIVGASLFRGRRAKSDKLTENFALAPRVILSTSLQWVLFLTVVVLCVAIISLFYTQFLTQECLSTSELKFLGMKCSTVTWLNGIIAAGLFVVALLIYNFADVVSGGLGVVRDIVTYATVSYCQYDRPAKIRANNFPLRRKIEGRFKRVLRHVLSAHGSIDQLTVISHSQGTVVATRVLQTKRAQKWLCAAKCKVTLVTMGSPVTHIYRRYFPEHFPVNFTATDTCAWVNIYRRDDFVGTRIREHPADPVVLTKEVSVTARGHTGYFTDREVWRKIKDTACFKLFV